MVTNYDVIIVGAGLNGLITSCILAEAGFKIALLEKAHLSKKLSTYDGRGIAISDSSYQLFKKYNLWSEITSKGYGEIKHIIVKDFNSSAYVKLDHALFGNSVLGFLIASDEIALGLYHKLQHYQNVDILDQTTCLNISSEPKISILTLDSGKNISAKLTIIADGKNSKIAELLGIASYKKDYQQLAFVFNIKHQKSHNHCAYEIFYPSGPFALLPLADLHQSAIVWAESTVDHNLDLNTQDFLEQLLQERCAETHGNCKIISQIKAFPLSLSYIKEYFKGRTVFIGDCLHYIHPIAGQGYNLSLRDIETITGLLIEYKQLGLDIGSATLLDNFTKQRKPHNLLMINFTDKLTDLFSNSNPLLSSGRKIGLNILDEIMHLRSKLWG